MNKEALKEFVEKMTDKVRVIKVQFEFTVDERHSVDEAGNAMAKVLGRPAIEDDYERLRAKLGAIDEMERIVEWIGPIEVIGEEVIDRAREPEESESGQNA